MDVSVSKARPIAVADSNVFPNDVPYYSKRWVEDKCSWTIKQFKVRNQQDWLKSPDNIKRLSWTQERCQQHLGEWGIVWKRISANDDLWLIFMKAKELGYATPDLDAVKRLIEEASKGGVSVDDWAKIAVISSHFSNETFPTVARVVKDTSDKDLPIDALIGIVKSCLLNIKKAEGRIE